jgi:hypothetical protein
MLLTSDSAVISVWDESHWVSKINEFSKPGREKISVGGCFKRIMFRSQSVVARVVGDETLVVPIRAGVADLASI